MAMARMVVLAETVISVPHESPAPRAVICCVPVRLSKICVRLPLPWQAPLTQLPLQKLPQAPQSATLVLRLVSQPLPALKSQSSNPALQAEISQLPPLQAGVPLATLHTLPQAPQFLRSESVSTQTLLQSVNWQLTMH